MKYALILIVCLSASPALFAKNKKQQLQNIGARLSTDHSFSGLDVNGRYKSIHGLHAVENEKPILDILDYPKTYSDRIKASKKWIR